MKIASYGNHLRKMLVGVLSNERVEFHTSTAATPCQVPMLLSVANT
jgi:hypothetical protein